MISITAEIDDLKSNVSYEQRLSFDNEAHLAEKVKLQEQTIHDLRTTLDMCQKVTAELENKKSSNEKDLLDMGNQVNELEDVISGLENERDEIKKELISRQDKINEAVGKQTIPNENDETEQLKALTSKLKGKNANQKEELKTLKTTIDELNDGVLIVYLSHLY